MREQKVEGWASREEEVWKPSRGGVEGGLDEDIGLCGKEEASDNVCQVGVNLYFT